MNIQDLFKKSVVEMVVLHLLNSEDMYGYQLVQEIAKRSGDVIVMPDASLYPVLYKMLENDLISETQTIVDGRLRRYYHIEEQGKQHLAGKYDDYNLMLKAISQILSSGN